MTTPQTDVQEVQRYLGLLYPDPPRDAWLVVSWLVSGSWRNEWFTIAQAAAATRLIVQYAQHYSVYVGLGLRHPQCLRQGRGTSTDVYALPGLWIELDHNAGVHAAQHLPTPHELLAFIQALPFRFSLLVDSSGGYHCYALFKELWRLDTPEEHQAASLLLRRFQRTIKTRAAAQGWQVDGTADLARVLRPTGTLNHKTRPPKPVTFLHEDAIRYNPSEIAEAHWLATIDDMYTPPADSRDFPPVPLQPIVDGCAWLRHCRHAAARLPEPEWYGMLGIIGRCADGEQMAHEWSAPYPRYSKDETTKKLQHALADAGPRTCSTIRFDLGADSSCRDCQHWEKIKSPIVLGMLHTQRPMKEYRPMPTYSATRDATPNGQPQATPGPEGATAIGGEGAGEEAVAALPRSAEDTRPVIRITTAMTDVVDQGQAALLALPDAPVIFQRVRRLCIIARGVKPPAWLHRPQDAPVILEASTARLRELTSHAARWEKHDARKDKWVTALPPSWFVETLQGRPSWPFPVLEGIIGAPTLRPDGSVLDTPGYDASTGLWFDSNGTHYPALVDKPTIDQARQAVNDVRDVLQDFPFVGSSFAAALAATLSVVCRFTIQGCVPLFAARSTTRGSGKGLLIDVLSIIGTGRPAPRWPQSDNDEEDRKRLLTVAMAGDATMHIDNVIKALGSPALELALTAPSVSDRILGKNAKVEAPLTIVWFASGNNMQFKSDTARRVVPMDLDAQMERPEERTGFAYPRLLDHVRHSRPALVSAALTIVHAYFQAGTPAQGLTPYGSFQEWSDIIRSAVVWSCDADPCEGRKDLEAESDPAFEYLATILDCWDACYPDTAVTLVRVLQDLSLWAHPIDANNPANKWHALYEALSIFDSTYRGQQLNARAIGVAMSRIVGRIIDGKRFVRGSKRTENGHTWQVVSVAIPVSAVSAVSKPNLNPESVTEAKSEASQSQREKTASESLTVSGKLLENPTALTALTGSTPTREVFDA